MVCIVSIYHIPADMGRHGHCMHRRPAAPWRWRQSGGVPRHLLAFAHNRGKGCHQKPPNIATFWRSCLCLCANFGMQIFHGLGSHSDDRVLFDSNFFFFPEPTGCQKRYPKWYPSDGLIETIQALRMRNGANMCFISCIFSYYYAITIMCEYDVSVSFMPSSHTAAIMKPQRGPGSIRVLPAAHVGHGRSC